MGMDTHWMYPQSAGFETANWLRQEAHLPWATGTATWVQRRVASFAVEAPDSACLFDSVISAHDVIQGGQLGSCWLVAALASLADRDCGDWIRQMFHLHDDGGVSPQGIYSIRVWGDGVPRYVFVDDILPCENVSGQVSPAFSRNRRPDEFWVPVLEKAICKLLGGYSHIEGG